MEYLPVLEARNGKLITVAKMERNAAHGENPQWHATSLIIAITSDGEILLADKYKKDALKARTKGEYLNPAIILDCFGGHLKYDDIPKEELTAGLSIDTYFNCAIRELGEELLAAGKKKIAVDGKRMSFLGLYEYENDHNKELSAAFVYRMDGCEKTYTSVDSVIIAGEEIEADQEIYYFAFEKLIGAYVSGRYSFSDGISRILEKHRIDGFASLKEMLAAPLCHE